MDKIKVRGVHREAWVSNYKWEEPDIGIDETLYLVESADGADKWFLRVEYYGDAVDADFEYRISDTEVRQWLSDNGFRNLYKAVLKRRKRLVKSAMIKGNAWITVRGRSYPVS